LLRDAIACETNAYVALALLHVLARYGVDIYRDNTAEYKAWLLTDEPFPPGNPGKRNVLMDLGVHAPDENPVPPGQETPGRDPDSPPESHQVK
jgi:hypothetical protein